MSLAEKAVRGVVYGLLMMGGVAPIGCSSVPSGYHKVQPTQIDVAVEEAPEYQRLDVGVAISEAAELPEKTMKKLGTNEDIRESERHFIPYHLKNTLETSSHWGVVRVVPPEQEEVDLRVASRLVRSNGEMLQLEVVATDAAGRVWLKCKYHEAGTVGMYGHSTVGMREAYQDLYNTVANDLSSFKRSLSPAELEEIRTVSQLKFAEDLAPEVFEGYLAEGDGGTLEIRRLPATGDPMMARIEQVRQREEMFIDTLDQYYEGFYMGMWGAYEDWREYNLIELRAMRQVKNEALFRGITGALMIAAAVALGSGDIGGMEAATGILIVAGSQIVIDGINVSQQAEIHADAVEELGASFGAEMRPTTIELEGKQYELTGTVGEQFTSWRELLRRMYLEETGYEDLPDLSSDGAGGSVSSGAPG